MELQYFFKDTVIKTLLDTEDNPWFCGKDVALFQDIIDKFNLNLNLVLKSKEQEYIQNIIEAFAHLNYKTQFSIGNYRIDLYFPDQKLAIECDEFGHKDRDINYEIARQKFIEEQLNCKFIRFNPDIDNFNIFKIINEIIQIIYV